MHLSSFIIDVKCFKYHIKMTDYHVSIEYNICVEIFDVQLRVLNFEFTG